MSRASATSGCSQGGIDTVDASDADCWQWMREPCCDIATLAEADLKRLQPLLWLELATLFDRHHVSLDKRKPYKRKRKEEGHVFGVSLNALIRRDQQVTGEDSSLVPLVLQGLLDELMMRGVREEGILRVPGNKQKIEAFHSELEQTFYANNECVGGILERAGVHDLSALLKRWLRELPTPLLASDLIHLFFQAHGMWFLTAVRFKSHTLTSNILQRFRHPTSTRPFRFCASCYRMRIAIRCVRFCNSSKTSSICRL